MLIIIQVVLIIAIAPLLSGVIRKAKNNLRMRKGPSVLQPYYNLAKFFQKEEVVSKKTSWIFRIAPFIVLASSITAAFLVPIFAANLYLNCIGDLLIIIFIFAAGRFFLALAGLDAGSAFGGMGSSREMFISSLMEPVIVLSIFAVSLNAGSTSIAALSGAHMIRLSTIIAAIAFFIAMIAETSRIPVDNQETHLELTMIHEAMVLEYSGRSLALIELASYIKQAVFFSLLANVIMPWQGIAMFIAKIISISLLISVIEISIAKMRLFRIVDLASFSFVMAVVSIIISGLGY
ncbi:MAG: NADH-quinone oxidoreductase subunit H [Candidatus Omnitrophota bacterium]|nr:NADH-quinone oxidoreductase subunit H [Candidatus Omnitrophota bacterium]